MTACRRCAKAVRRCAAMTACGGGGRRLHTEGGEEAEGDGREMGADGCERGQRKMWQGRANGMGDDGLWHRHWSRVALRVGTRVNPPNHD